MSSKVITFNEALRDATALYMEKDPNVFVIGLYSKNEKPIY